MKLFLLFIFAFATTTRGQLASYLLAPLHDYFKQLPPIRIPWDRPTTVIPKFVDIQAINSIDKDKGAERTNGKSTELKSIQFPKRLTEKATPLNNPQPKFGTVAQTKPTTSIILKTTSEPYDEFFNSEYEPDDEQETKKTAAADEVTNRNTVMTTSAAVKSTVTLVLPALATEKDVDPPASQTEVDGSNRIDSPLVLPTDSATRLQIQNAIRSGQLGARSYLKTIPRIRYSDSSKDASVISKDAPAIVDNAAK